MKKIAVFLVIVMLFQSVSSAFVSRTVTVTMEKIIPFSFTSDSESISESLNIKGLDDVEIKSMYVDNGKIKASVDKNYIDVEFSEGEFANNYKTISKVGTIELNNEVLTDEDAKKIIVTPENEVKSIYEVSGDFEGAKINDDGDIEINIKSSAEGKISYDKDSLVKSEFIADISDKNLNREVKTSLILPYEIKGNIKAKSGDTSAVQEITYNEREVNITFNNGIPIPNENTIKSGHTFFWIDRNVEGIFNKYNPNSVYSTDINKITGNGKYLDESEFDEIGITVSSDEWIDYCGIEKDGVRYIYVFDESKGIPNSFIGNLVKGNELEFIEQNFNSEKYSVEFSNAGVSYVPEGKLYSMGELVSNTYGWGETYPNKENESTKTFFNDLTGKNETYVKHFKFFYGPKEKTTFGGYYTYPYKCVFEYEHYKPVKGYSGEVTYEYESKEKVNGYSYNGWIKIAYKAEKEVNDYPPYPPFNVKYNSSTGDITWDRGSDDYTKEEELKYEVQIFDGEWKSIANKSFDELFMNYGINYLEPDVRIRTIDEMGQFSDFSYASEGEIELNGRLEPYIVNPGDSIDIFADTKSLSQIKNVIARNSQMQMYLELQKVEETTSNFFELSYDIEADFPEEADEILTITNGRVAMGNKDDIKNYKFSTDDEEDSGYVNFEIIKDPKIHKDGSLIFSNLNYNDIPLDMFFYNSSYWLVKWNNTIYLKNKVTGEKEVLLRIETDSTTKKRNNRNIIVPEYIVTVNKFKYDGNGYAEYEEISFDKKYLSKPFILTWNTDAAGVTSFSLYSENELLYTYEAFWEDINSHVDKIYYGYMSKEMKEYKKASYGYTTLSNAKRAKWNKIVLSLIPKHDLRSFTWLGYKVRNNEYVNSTYIDDYNSNPKVTNNYRMLIMDTCMSKAAIKRYLDILKTTNISMTRDKETIFGDDAVQYTSSFESINIKIPEDIEVGCYDIILTATDIEGNSADCVLTLVVQDDKNKEEEPKEEEKVENTIKPTVMNSYFGRFFYRDGNGYLEELKKTSKTDNNGFVCAGETLGFSLVTQGVEYIEVDFLGDASIKTLDNLTKKFLIDKPREEGKDTENIKYQYMNFPKKIYPQYVDNLGIQVFKWFYTIPYKTNQSLESWSTLKNNTLEKIDVDRLFDKKTEPYTLVLYLNGDRENAIHLSFDIFERWDTVLNRDVTEYIVNSDTKWEMRIDK